jgi:hypothetical protein
MSDWFFMVGEPLGSTETEQVVQYLRGLGLDDTVSIERPTDWSSAGTLIKDTRWDARWWEAEQREAKRLHELAARELGADELSRRLAKALERSMNGVHGAAAVQAARGGCSDPALIRAAAGAAGHALHLAEVARLSGESAAHPFLLKQALFAGGRWPLGIVNGSYYLF